MKILKLVLSLPQGWFRDSLDNPNAVRNVYLFVASGSDMLVFSEDIIRGGKKHVAKVALWVPGLAEAQNKFLRKWGVNKKLI